MGTYAGALPAGPGTFPLAVCFSAGTANAMDKAITLLTGFMGIAYGAVIGLVLGLIVSLVTGPELLSKAVGMGVGAALGAVIGGVAGAVFMARQIAAGACPCPPGARAFCLNFWFVVSAGGTAVPLPIPPTAAPAACALVPAACVP